MYATQIKFGESPLAEAIPIVLTERTQWVTWKYSQRTSGNRSRMCKVPVSAATKTIARSDSPETWTDFQTAWAYYEANRPRLAGVGYVFSPDDPFIGIDLDSCRDLGTGRLASWADRIVHVLDSYTEVSPSGSGLKIILSSKTKLLSRRRSAPDVEIYSSHRYFTITGYALPGMSRVEERSMQVSRLHLELFPKPQTDASPSLRMSSDEAEVPDDQILKRAFAANNGDKFIALWKGSLNHHQNNHSQADLSLCRILAFWTGPRPDQIDRLFRRSALFRSKWDECHFADGTTYGQMTIEKAISAQGTTFYSWRSSRP